MFRTLTFATIVLALAGTSLGRTRQAWMNDSIRKMETELVAKYGEGQHSRITHGLGQAADFWRAEDGDAAAFEEFVRTSFAGDQASLDTLFNRMQFVLESVYGYMTAVGRDLRRQADLDIGPMQPYDEVLAGYNAAAHINDDFFANKVAFTVLLNFPLTTLDERLAKGGTWTRRQWAETKLADAFSKRIPADVNLAASKMTSEASQYVSTYNIWMHHLVDAEGKRLFPESMRLLEHWNLRDEIKADYSDAKDGLAKQRAIVKVMERIVDQSIPNTVVDNPAVDWNPVTNETKPAAVHDARAGFTPEAKIDQANSRYAMILKTFQAARLIDKYSPTAPTLIARRFEEDRQIPEARVRAMLESVMSSPLVPRVAALIEKRLGRKLEPFDVWYNGFRPRGQYTEAQLDKITKKRYPTPAAYKADMTRLFTDLGFSAERARMLADNIVVDPARGSGHAMGAGRRDDHPHLRTRVGEDGMVQHRRARDGAQRRADVLAQLHRLLHELRRPEHRVHRGPGLRLPEPRSRASRTVETDRRIGRPEDAQRLLGDVRDRWRGHGRPGDVALDVRPPQRHTGGAEGRRGVDLEECLEPLVRAGVPRQGRDAPRHLRPHGRFDDVSPRLPDRPPHRLPDRRADAEGGERRRRIRADGQSGLNHPRPLDEERDGSTGGAGRITPRDGEGTGSFEVATLRIHA